MKGMPSPVVVLNQLQARPHTWSREGSRAAVSSDGAVRLTLGVLCARVEWKDENGMWLELPATFETRRRLGDMLEVWLESKLAPDAGEAG